MEKKTVLSGFETNQYMKDGEAFLQRDLNNRIEEEIRTRELNNRNKELQKTEFTNAKFEDAKVWFLEKYNLTKHKGAKIRLLAFEIQRTNRAIDGYLQNLTISTPKQILEYEGGVMYLELLNQLYSENNPSEEEDILKNTIVKLRWNDEKNKLTDLFYQLKRLSAKKNKTLIDNSNEEIAQFLVANFECFSKTKLSTVLGDLKKASRPKKSGIDVNTLLED